MKKGKKQQTLHKQYEKQHCTSSTNFLAKKRIGHMTLPRFFAALWED